MTRLAILHSDDLTRGESSLFELASVLGVDAEYVCVTRPDFPGDELLKHLLAARAIAMSAATLCALEDRNLLWGLFDKLGLNPSLGFFIYGYQPDRRHVALLRRLTQSAIAGIESVRNGIRCSFPTLSRAHTRQLAGCDFEREPSPADCCFRLESGPGVQTLMEVAGNPALVLMSRGNTQWFHWAAVDAIAHPSARIGEGSLSRRCDRFVPPIIFLRALLPDCCWENPVKTARLTIDDPLLQRNYGFLDYEHLADSLTSLGYGATTAFIPWNYRRTTLSNARFFSQLVPAHSICVHGCDHTNNEFGVADEHLLEQKALLALERMEIHHQRTGIPYDPVMVFPQGKFSIGAIRALRLAGFLAVVNSTRIPTDSPEGSLTLAEELLPATNCLFGLPIFTRRYPKQLSSYALDLFLGKPAHIVEHHDWFARGCSELEYCVRFLKEVEPDLTWPSLGEGLERHHLRRRGTDGSCKVQFFTPTFEFANPQSEACSFDFSKAEPEPGLVEDVTVDGKSVQFGHENGLIMFRHELRPLQRLMVRLRPARQPDTKAWAPSFKYRAQVRLRRAVSELRDNHLAKHPALLRAAKYVVRSLKLSSDAKSGGGTRKNRPPRQ